MKGGGVKDVLIGIKIISRRGRGWLIFFKIFRDDREDIFEVQRPRGYSPYTRLDVAAYTHLEMQHKLYTPLLPSAMEGGPISGQVGNAYPLHMVGGSAAGDVESNPDRQHNTQLLGVHLTKDISNKSIASTVHKFYGKVNSVLYDFKNVPCHVKSKLLATYCLDLYGSCSYGITAVLMFNRFMLLGATQ